MRVCQEASVSLRALTRNLILSRESRQYEMPGQARQDTGNDFDIAPVN